MYQLSKDNAIEQVKIHRILHYIFRKNILRWILTYHSQMGKDLKKTLRDCIQDVSVIIIYYNSPDEKYEEN